jgi:hypothetical protein
MLNKKIRGIATAIAIRFDYDTNAAAALRDAAQCWN